MQFIIMKKHALLLTCVFAFSLLIPNALAASVSRTFSSTSVAPGGEVIVTLSVDVSGGADYYAIDEIYPTGFTVADGGIGSTQHAGHWKHVVIQDAANSQFAYRITAPATEGVYEFSGEYMFGGMADPVPITGQSSLTVTTASFNITGIAIAGVVVLVLVLLVAMKKMPK
jgi:hypothetical protein